METKVIMGIIPDTPEWRKSMLNANRADKEFTPNYMKFMSKSDLEKLIAKLSKK